MVASPEVCFRAWARCSTILFSASLNEWDRAPDREDVVVLLLDGHELEEGVGAVIRIVAFQF
jgi:hypothetical protein